MLTFAGPTRHLLRWTILFLAFPFRLLATLLLMAFDLVLSRWLIALPVVTLVWLPLYFLLNLSMMYLVVGTIILGTMLAGLWEGCSMFVLHPLVPKWVYFQAPLPLLIDPEVPDDA